MTKSDLPPLTDFDTLPAAPERSLARDLASLLNGYSAENASNTPDFILAEYLLQCLSAFEAASNAREKWYGRHLRPVGTL